MAICEGTTKNAKCDRLSLRRVWLSRLVGGFRGAAYGFVNFVTMHGHFLRSLDTQANFVASDFDHDNRDIVIDDDTLVLLAG